MPAKHPRLNIHSEKPEHEILHCLAKRDWIPLSLKARDLVRRRERSKRIGVWPNWLKPANHHVPQPKPSRLNSTRTPPPTSVQPSSPADH
jgi:hypothetical protein